MSALGSLTRTLHSLIHRAPVSLACRSLVKVYALIERLINRNIYRVCGGWLQEKLKLVTVLGAGLLVGTALAVIIPEGVHTMYLSAQGTVGLPIYDFRITG